MTTNKSPWELLAYAQGRKAYMIGRTLASNPYTSGSDLAQAFYDGFDDEMHRPDRPLDPPDLPL